MFLYKYETDFIDFDDVGKCKGGSKIERIVSEKLYKINQVIEENEVGSGS